MAAQYLLPCECGKTTPIDTSQAGSSVTCVCGNHLEVPSLRAIRELTPQVQATDAGKYQWNQTAGLTFASGLVIALIGGGAAVLMHLNVVEFAKFKPPPEEVVTAWIEAPDIDNAPAEEILDMWNTAKSVGLGEYEMSDFVLSRIVIKQRTMYRNMGLIVVACGLAFAASSIFLRRKAA
jgi:hypothetical protein